MTLVDDLADQARLEALLDATKPALPRGCGHLHYLLFTPFRYPPSRRGSRWRAPHATHGAFYAAEAVETAAIETAFHRVLVLAESPSVPLPQVPTERRGFAARVKTEALLDLTQPPFDADAARWTDRQDYGPTQSLATAAVAEGIAALRSTSARDPQRRANLTLLDCAAFAAPEPMALQSWWIFVRARVVQAWCEAPRIRLEIPLAHFAADPRIAAWLSSRGA
jgi:hypothetical protein